MTKRPAKKPGPQPPAAKTTNQTTEPAREAARPLKPRPALFAVLLVAFAIWLAGLLTLYFTKVYPMRYPASAPAAGVKS
jgi:hypothetical protein